MRVLITGGGGFLGQMLARAIVVRGGLGADATRQLADLVLFDQTFPRRGIRDGRITQFTGDVTKRAVLARVCSRPFDAVFHLAAVVSAGAEADFDLGMRVNLDGVLAVLETCRGQLRPPRVVFASSVAAFGGELPAFVVDTTAAAPQSSYGMQKVVAELLIADYTRKGYVDGRSVRLPTIVVRPGKPNRAASGFMSSILREPLAGESAVCPVPASAKMWILSPERAVEALVHAAELPGDVWGSNRTLNAPGITVSVEEALAALRRIAGHEVAARVTFQPDPAIEKIVLSWPTRFVTERADSLGFKHDEDIEEIIGAHMATQRL